MDALNRQPVHLRRKEVDATVSRVPMGCARSLRPRITFSVHYSARVQLRRPCLGSSRPGPTLVPQGEAAQELPAPSEPSFGGHVHIAEEGPGLQSRRIVHHRWNSGQGFTAPGTTSPFATLRAANQSRVFSSAQQRADATEVWDTAKQLRAVGDDAHRKLGLELVRFDFLQERR